MAGLSFAMVVWQSMHFAASGKPMSSPGSAFVWQTLHSSPFERWVLWLNGIGCAGAVGWLDSVWANSETAKAAAEMKPLFVQAMAIGVVRSGR